MRLKNASGRIHNFENTKIWSLIINPFIARKIAAAGAAPKKVAKKAAPKKVSKKIAKKATKKVAKKGTKKVAAKKVAAPKKWEINL